MKSRIINKKPIDTDYVIVIDDVNVDPKSIELHRQRIDTIFANQSEQYRLEQLNKMIMHDILFSKAMDHLYSHYEINIDDEDLETHIDFIKTNSHEDQKFTPELEEIIKATARKIIVQKLIFDDIQKEKNIIVSDSELETILQNYYKETNQPIRSFKQDPSRYEEARTSIINEKIISTIISMFKFDPEKFMERIKKAEEEIKNKNN